MVDTNKLRGKIAEAGMSCAALASLLGITKNTLSSKMNGKSDFTVPEANRICEILSIKDGKTKASIFLA